ncbi:hypothetical protein ACX43S_25340 [Enterobacter cloacae]
MMTISALAVPGDNSKGAGTMQSQKVRHWEGITLGEIVSTIAKENKLVPKVSASLASMMPGYLDQGNENDAEFLARLARQFGAVSKSGGGCWIFAERGAGVSVSGKPLPSLTIRPSGQTRWQFAHRSKSRTKSRSRQGKGWGRDIITYLDAGSGTHKTITVGSGDPPRPDQVLFFRTVKRLNSMQEICKSSMQKSMRSKQKTRKEKKQKAATGISDEYVSNDAGHAGNDGPDAGV